MAKKKDVPVYLFTGFLDSGKTTFIQKTLEDSRFNAGESTLLVLCEEGDVEYDPASFAADNVALQVVEDPSELTEENLKTWLKVSKAERVMVEYNGMWLLDGLYAALPEDWIVAQEITFADAASYASYNANMRNLVYDKLKSCEVVLFNRLDGDTDTMALHRIVRQSNRRCNIAYEYKDGHSEPDTIEDPLPFDLDAPVVKIADKDYALFYSDLMEDMEKYDGKTVEFLSLCAHDASLPGGVFVGGRHMMNCCAADIQFAGLLCYWPGAGGFGKGSWMRLTGKLVLEENKIYAGRGPVIRVSSAVPEPEPADPVATFY